MRNLLLTTTILTCSTAALAFAQEGVVELDGIVLYGDRAAEVFDESQSVAVVTQEQLDAATNPTIADAFRRVAGITDGDFTESGFVMRGINSEGLTPGGAGAPLASTYIDGVQLTQEAARRGPRGVFDAEQLEIYRGPQSTLSGRNALAGAIYLRTKDPEFERSGKARLRVGSDNLREVGLAYGDALSETLAYRVSGQWFRQESQLNFPSYEGYNGYDALSQDEYYNVRAKVLWLPTDATEVLVSFNRSYESPTTNQIAGPNWTPNPDISYDDLRGDIYGSLTPGFYGMPYLPIFQDVRDTTVNNLGVEVTHNFDNGITLTAMTSFSDSMTDRRSINEGMSNPANPFDPINFNVKGGFDQRIFSQELRLNGETERMDWVAGLYYAREKNEGRRTQFAPNTTFTSLETTETKNSADITNTAIFGELSYEFAPSWDVILGGRLDRYSQKTEAKLVVTDAFAGPLSDNTTTSDYESTSFIPKVGVSYEFAGGSTMALIYREGYRPGGSGLRVSDGVSYNYDAEKAKNLELSWRGSLQDDRLRMGANLFYQNWDNQQVEVWDVPTDPSSSYIANAGKSKSYGLEVDLAYEATDTLDLYGGIALLRTEFEEFTVGSLNFSGQEFSNAPEQSIVLGFDWHGHSGWFAGASMKHVGASLSRIEATRQKLNAYTTVDAQLGYEWNNGMVLTAYATNLFDKEYFTYQSAPGGLAATGKGREFGIMFDTTF